MKKIGVLGGMGPESTAQFYKNLIRECQRQYGAKYDDDYPEIFIYSLPIPDVVKSLSNPQKTTERLTAGIQILENAGAEIIAVPCNTVELFIPEIRKDTKIPILSIIEQTVSEIKKRKYETVGLLATKMTIDNKLYENYLDKIRVVKPKNQATITKIILNVMAGKKSRRDKNKITKIINQLRIDGCEAIILGCTDLPILIGQKDTSVTLIDSLGILAKKTIEYANQNRTK